jgi:hypothetical protein
MSSACGQAVEAEGAHGSRQAGADESYRNGACPRRQWRLGQPVLAIMMRSAAASRSITAVVAVHLGLLLANLPAWPCPLRHVTGCPCPGCGLSRAIVALFAGDWSMMWRTHAFAPLVVIALAMIAVAAVLPARARLALAHWTEIVERRSGITVVLLLFFMLYWIARFAVALYASALTAGV